MIEIKALKTVFLVALLAYFSPKALAETGWVLLERTPIGMYNVFVGKDAVRVNEVKTNYSIISKAPDWNVTFFRDDHKIICSIPPKKWEVEGLFTMNERNLVKRISKNTKPSAKIISGLKYWEYKIPLVQSRRYANGKIINMTGFMSTETNVKKIHSTHANLLVSPIISTNKDIVRTLSSLFVVPIGDGVPIKFTIKYNNGVDHNPLLTNKIGKTSLPPNIFEIPKHYKKVKNIQLISTGNRPGEIDDFIMDLGLGDSFGGKKGSHK